jgi:hypothetical protein
MFKFLAFAFLITLVIRAFRKIMGRVQTSAQQPSTGGASPRGSKVDAIDIDEADYKIHDDRPSESKGQTSEDAK